MKNSYDIQEEISRLAFTRFAEQQGHIWDIRELPTTSKHDCDFVYDFLQHHAEIKTRPVYSNHVYTGKPDGFILEFDKYCYLTGLTHTTWYVNVFKDKIAIWDVSQIIPNWKQETFVKKNLQPELGTVTKTVTYLQISASTYTYDFPTNFYQLKQQIESSGAKAG